MDHPVKAFLTQIKAVKIVTYARVSIKFFQETCLWPWSQSLIINYFSTGRLSFKRRQSFPFVAKTTAFRLVIFFWPGIIKAGNG
jgi:hypothetical protein